MAHHRCVPIGHTDGTVRDVFALFGRQAEDIIRSFHVDKAILSCTGLNLKGQFTEAGIENANIKKAMMAASREVILAMDEHKFDRTAFLSVGSLDQVTAVVTNADPGQQWREFLDAQGVQLVSGT